MTAVMRFNSSLIVLLAILSRGLAFIPSQNNLGRRGQTSACKMSTVEAETDVSVEHISPTNGVHAPVTSTSTSPRQLVALSATQINERLEQQLAKLREKDSKSPHLRKEDIKVVFDDENIIVVDKPSGVLCVPDRDGHHNLAEAVYGVSGCEMGRADCMVVHRLGMDTSGLVVFAKTLVAVRAMNAIFRARKIERTYEALVCGHLSQDVGFIDLPLMRDYEYPPFMRVSTDEHQRFLADFDVNEIGKKLLEKPKQSLTRYHVVAREELGGHPVTRVTLSSVSGRTHQLNVHLAAFGHPIVGDTTYGIDGYAAPNGGLSDGELDILVPNPSRASTELQRSISNAAAGKVCVHGKSLKFRHPITKREISLSTNSPF